MRGFRRSLIVLMLGAVAALVAAGTAGAQSYASTLSATVVDCSSVTVTGTDWEENADVTIGIASDSPSELGTIETDDEGAFTATFPLSKSLGNGEHVITATSEWSSSSVGVTLTGCAAAGALASTGSDSLPWVAIGVALVLVGAVLAVITHRRRTAHSISV